MFTHAAGKRNATLPNHCASRHGHCRTLVFIERRVRSGFIVGLARCEPSADKSSRRIREREAVGSITAYGADSLRFTPAKANRQLTLPLDEIASIDRSKGRDHVLGAAVGAVGGAIGGVLLGIACVSVCSDSHSSDANLAPIGGFVIGLPAGTILGALVGIERWQRVRFR
jgi:hypothetical protein